MHDAKELKHSRAIFSIKQNGPRTIKGADDISVAQLKIASISHIDTNIRCNGKIQYQIYAKDCTSDGDCQDKKPEIKVS